MDWNLPTETTDYIQVLSNLKDRDIDATTLCLNVPVNPPTGTIRLARTPNILLEEWTGSVWTPRIMSVQGGGTGAANLDAFKASLGLGTMAYQNSNAVTITGGTAALASLNVNGEVSINAGYAIIHMVENSAPVDHKRWYILAQSTTFAVYAVNDVVNAALPVFQAFRSGITPTSFKIFPGVAINCDYVPTDTKTLQLGGNVAMQTSGGYYGWNLYVTGAWKYFGNGPAAMLYFDGVSNFIVYGAPSNASGAGAGAPIAANFVVNVHTGAVTCGTISSGIITSNGQVNCASIFCTGPVSLGSTLTVTGVTTLSSYVKFYDDAGGAPIRIHGRASDNIGLIAWYNNAGTVHFYSLISDLAGVLTFYDGVTGKKFLFSGDYFYANSAQYCGHPSKRWGMTFGTYFDSVTGNGFIFNGSSTTGMGFDGTNILLMNQAQTCAYFTNGFFKMRNPCHFGPETNGALYCGAPNNYWYQAWVVNGVWNGSSLELKNILRDESLGLDFINRIKPVEYKWKKQTFIDESKPLKTRHGLVIEQIIEALGGVEFDGVDEEGMGLNYSEFIAPIIRAIQELDKKVEELKNAR
jgi:hypothetical protein